jgi:hypothetical protein
MTGVSLLWVLLFRNLFPTAMMPQS